MLIDKLLYGNDSSRIAESQRAQREVIERFHEKNARDAATYKQMAIAGWLAFAVQLIVNLIT